MSSLKYLGRLALTAALLVVNASGLAANAPTIPLKDFVREPEFTAVKISPDGKYVAFLTPSGNSASIGVIRLEDKKFFGRFQMDADNKVVDFWWASDFRIVASLATQLGSLDTLSATGELVAFDADGSKARYLSGYRGQAALTTGTRLGGTATRAASAAFIIDPLIDDRNNILVAFRSFEDWDSARQVVYRLNIYDGSKSEVDLAPAFGGMRFVSDRNGAVRYAVSNDDALGVRVWQHVTGTKEWETVKLPDGTEGAVGPLGLSADGKSVFLVSGEFGPFTCLVQHVLTSNERRKLACDNAADLQETISAFDASGEPIAAVFAAGKPVIKLLDTGNPTAPLLGHLMKAFPGKIVRPTSVTRDGRKALVQVYDDRTPGDYYFFDTAVKNADFFVALREWLNPDQMAERRPVELKARDGTILHGYLTLPHNVDPKNLPLVVNPHGGPFHVRDSWAFDDEPQLLASRGYAVLQVNFRGSPGYGSQFVNAGRKAWGTTMIDDITDATRWTIAQGFANPSRICIYGASYGGFAALMSAVREPDLYRCVVGYAGVYDLKKLRRDSDITENKSGRNYFANAIAGTDEEMTAQSPINHLDKLKAPMLIVHGEEDVRTPFSQATALRKAMKAGNHPFEWLSRPGEGHGFRKLENIEAFDQQLLEFLDRNIGPAAVAGTGQ